MNIVTIVLCAFIALSLAIDPIFESIESSRNTWRRIIADYVTVKDYIRFHIRIIDDISLENLLSNEHIRNLTSDVQPFNDLILQNTKEGYNAYERAELSIDLCKSNAYNNFNVLLNTTFIIFNNLIYFKNGFESELARCFTDSNINHNCVQVAISKNAENQIMIQKYLEKVKSMDKDNTHLFGSCVTSVEKKLLLECLSLYRQQ